jgi:hypothetical protein
MRMIRRLAEARRPDHGPATHATGTHPGATAADLDEDLDEDLDDVTGHLRRPETSLTATPSSITQPDAGPIPSDLLAPIAGVSVDQYVAVCALLAAHRYDPSRLPAVTSEAGIDTAAWDVAAAGFNARVSASAAFARHFNALYRAALLRAT